MKALAAIILAQDRGGDMPCAGLAEARAEVEALRKDAERYRWLRNPTSNVYQCYQPRGDYGKGLMTGESLDAAIDDARAKEPNDH
jgi:hypothetical protein